MAAIFQCIPNFSDGRSESVVQAIVEAINSSCGIRTIDFSMDPDHNRSVVTMLGSYEEVLCGVLCGVRKAVETIDLTKHIGGHPRIGAVDVIPVVPVQDATKEEAIVLSKAIGSAIGSELLVPVYLYEWSATKPERANLAKVRAGGFEYLRSIELAQRHAPDYGPSHVHPTAGAVAVGARGPLVAFNVNLNTSDIGVARQIASDLRKLRGTPAELRGVKAIALELPSRQIVQVSTNITQPDQTGLFEVYAFIAGKAAELGVEVLESELIGTSRLECLLDPVCRALKLPGLDISRIIDLHIDQTSQH